MIETTGLDIHTPRGQMAARDQMRAAETIMSHCPDGYSFVHTDPRGKANVDGIIVKRGVVHGVVEIKSRYDMTHEDFVRNRNNEWLISYDKIEALQYLADVFDCTAFGWLYIVQSGVVLSVSIYDNHGNPLVPIKRRTRETDRCINGGRKKAEVALISMNTAKINHVTKDSQV